MTTATYRTNGPVCGDCGHRHRTLSGVVRCQDQHDRGCASQGGYSDRRIEVEDDGTFRRLDDEEQFAANRIRGIC